MLALIVTLTNSSWARFLGENQLPDYASSQMAQNSGRRKSSTRSKTALLTSTGPYSSLWRVATALEKQLSLVGSFYGPSARSQILEELSQRILKRSSKRKRGRS